MLTQSAAKRLGDVHQSPLVAELHNVSGAKFRHAAAALSTTPVVRADSKRQGFQQARSRKQSTKTGASDGGNKFRCITPLGNAAHVLS